MAHGDYHCCAICDSKMDYAGCHSARTKEDICSYCLKALREAEVNVLDVSELLEWMKTEKPDRALAVLIACGYSECFYCENPVDMAVRKMKEQVDFPKGDSA